MTSEVSLHFSTFNEVISNDKEIFCQITTIENLRYYFSSNIPIQVTQRLTSVINSKMFSVQLLTEKRDAKNVGYITQNTFISQAIS